jgi:cell division protein FtsL
MLGIVISIIAVAMSIILVGIQLLSLRKSIDLLSARIVEEKN